MVVLLAAVAIIATMGVAFGGGAHAATSPRCPGYHVCQSASPRPSSPRPTVTPTVTPSPPPVPTATVTPSPGPQTLPQTGSPTTAIYVVGGILVVTGAILIGIGRRRKPRPQAPPETG